jgi:hypothetical protein
VMLSGTPDTTQMAAKTPEKDGVGRFNSVCNGSAGVRRGPTRL